MLSATDLANHLSCRHLTQLHLLCARGQLEKPYRDDPGLEVLRRKGEDHERAYLDHLAADGLRLVELPEGNHDVNATRQALEDGPDVIARAWLADGRWVGCADVLLRVPGQSALGEYHYEVVDTKLATRTKPRTILQLCLYADLLAALQGRRPDRIKVVPPGDGFEPETYRVDQYEAYYRRVKAHLDAATGGDGTAYPEPCEHCNVCDWWRRCDTRRHDDDHLSLVAGIVEVRARAELHNTEGKKIGNVVGIDTIAMTVDIKQVGRTEEEELPRCVYACKVLPGKTMRESLVRLGKWVVDNGVDAGAAGSFARAGRDLLLRHPPRRASTGRLRGAQETSVDAARRLAGELDGGMLPIQGPPGSGKTHAGARMIVELVKQGKRIGVSAVSHKVIDNLLRSALVAAGEEAMELKCLHKEPLAKGVFGRGFA